MKKTTRLPEKPLSQEDHIQFQIKEYMAANRHGAGDHSLMMGAPDKPKD